MAKLEAPAPEVVIADAGRAAVVRLEWDRYCLRVVLEDPPQIRVSASVYAAFARELAVFFRELTGCPPQGDAMRRVSSSDDELSVEAWADGPGLVGLGVSLAEDMWDLHWVVRVNLVVAAGSLADITASVESLARYAEGLPPSPAA